MSTQLLAPIRLDTETSETSAENLAPGIIYSWAKGRTGPEHVELILKYETRAVLQHPDGLWIFHDWSELEGAAPGARKRFVEWQKKHESSVFRVELTFRSRMVAMAVSVASLVLPNIKVHKSPDQLRTALVDAIRLRREGAESKSA